MADATIEQVLATLPSTVIAWDIGFAYNGGPYSARVVTWRWPRGVREFWATHETSPAAALAKAIGRARAGRPLPFPNDRS